MGVAEMMAGISVTNKLKPISTKASREVKSAPLEQCDSNLSPPATPKDRMLPDSLPCPPAPRKRRSSAGCLHNGAVEFFIPPDLETVFIRRVQDPKNSVL